MKNIINLFRLTQENEATKDRRRLLQTRKSM